METPNLDQLRPTLEAIPAAQVKMPGGMPISTYTTEAETLSRLIGQTDVRSELEHVGVPAANLDIFPTAVGAAVEAQSLWVQFRDRKNSPEYNDAIAESEKLRDAMTDACRWNLRDNQRAQAALDVIYPGKGVPDLNQDLHDLAGLIENNLDKFDADQSFDAQAAATRARALREILLGEAASHHHAFDKEDAKEQRDRAFTYLDKLVDEIRRAGRYAYRGDEAMTTRFVSGYWRRQRIGDDEPAIEPAGEDVTDPTPNPAPADA
ncbi:hypothetical protein FIV42_11365 [Persicimonas caeni]|uniref:Uncharacterized protein n=1 Tax=Persicimonas caeni TaxID=2292766 RepID=A0A4Y6PSN6_PERCE|nr:hypothetical protein [Persicimonas caeni]QDG51318.1 hypothetical protein FIV42_11365 [Persicimonas caeni]QED32539.1 hypothetical protein FRD00_11360 [Persicimonas caeni]